MPKKLPQEGVPVASALTDRVVNRLARPLGLEVELSEWGSLQDIPARSFSYREARDGSVQPSGREMVLDPLVGDGFVRGVLELGEMLVRGGAEVNSTCGLHVHVGGGDLGFFDLRRLLLMYRAVEEDIYSRVLSAQRVLDTHYFKRLSRERHQKILNLQRLTKNDELKHAIAKMVYGDMGDMVSSMEKRALVTAWRETKKNKYGYSAIGQASRYLGLNLVSWFHRGTIEWRMHEGTVAVQDLLHWPLFCGWFVELAGSLNDSAVAKITRLEDVLQRMPKHIGLWVEGKQRARQRAVEVVN